MSCFHSESMEYPRVHSADFRRRDGFFGYRLYTEMAFRFSHMSVQGMKSIQSYRFHNVALLSKVSPYSVLRTSDLHGGSLGRGVDPCGVSPRNAVEFVGTLLYRRGCHF